MGVGPRADTWRQAIDHALLRDRVRQDITMEAKGSDVPDWITSKGHQTEE